MLGHGFPGHTHLAALSGRETLPSASRLSREIARLERLSAKKSSVAVVDDMQTMRLLLGQALSSMGFKNIHRASDGHRGLEAILGDPLCDLALVDWNMPGMDGLELLNRVRAHPDIDDIVFIMVTAENMDRQVVRAAQEKQDAYLTKPVSGERLSRRLELIVQRRLVTARAHKLEVEGKPERAVEEFMLATRNHPGARWPIFGLGAVLTRAGQYSEAESCYRRLMELDPDAVSAKVALGRIRMEQDRAEEAQALFREAVEKNPLFFKAYDALADSYLQEGDLSQALAVMEEAVRDLGAESAARQEYIGELSYELQNWHKAEEALAKAQELKPLEKSPARRLLLARSRLAQGKVELALEDLKMASREAAELASEIDQLDSMLLMGLTHLHYQDHAAAEHQFKKIGESSQWHEGKVPFAARHLLREVAALYLHEGHSEQATQQFAESAAMDLGDRDNIRLIIQRCQEARAPEVAEASLNRARHDQEKLVEAYSRRGLTLVNEGRLSDARREYEQGLLLAPQSGRLRFNLAKLHFRTGSSDEGFQALVEALKIGIRRQDWELVAEVARVFALAGRVEEARQLLRQILGREGEVPRLRNLLHDLETSREPLVG